MPKQSKNFNDSDQSENEYSVSNLMRNHEELDEVYWIGRFVEYGYQ